MPWFSKQPCLALQTAGCQHVAGQELWEQVIRSKVPFVYLVVGRPADHISCFLPHNNPSRTAASTKQHMHGTFKSISQRLAVFGPSAKLKAAAPAFCCGNGRQAYSLSQQTIIDQLR